MNFHALSAFVVVLGIAQSHDQSQPECSVLFTGAYA